MTTTISSHLEERSESYSVVIDIDDESLEKYGQWPWPRILDAELIKKIDSFTPSAIGVNIVFPEADRTSPASIQKFYERYLGLELKLDEFPEYLRDNDKLLHDVITHANVTLPIYLKNGVTFPQHCDDMQYKNNKFEKLEPTLGGSALVCNHESIQEGVENFGFINASEDSDGVLRRIPLFMKYNEKIFPSFSLAMLWSFYEEFELDTSEEMLLINFTKNRPELISASRLLNSEDVKDVLQGKVAVLASSVTGLNASYQTPMGEHVSNGMIHALLLENMLTQSYLIQPKYYKAVNILLSFVTLLFLIFFVTKKYYFYSFMFILILVFISLIALFFNFINGIYISIGYFWTPFLMVVVLFILYHLRVLSQEQQEQEKLLIRQSKLASMGEMISIIAHQWRQPLSSINGTVLNLDIDYRNKKLDEKRFDNYLNEIEQRTAYLSSTITDFREFFSVNKESEEFKLSKVIKQAIHLSSLRSDDLIDISLRRQDTLIINGFSSELIQSLLVLLNNAIFVCKSKIETIERGEIFIDVVPEGQKVFISVSDNGGGIEKKNLKKVFNPYFTTKDKQNGTGLGLYILKLIVEDSMNGKVSVKNGEKGAIFTIEIPKSMK